MRKMTQQDFGSHFCPECMRVASAKDLNRCASCGFSGHGFYSNVARFDWIPTDFGDHFNWEDIWVTEGLEKLQFKTNQGSATIYKDPRTNKFHGALNQKSVETMSFSMCLYHLLSRANHKE